MFRCVDLVGGGPSIYAESMGVTIDTSWIMPDTELKVLYITVNWPSSRRTWGTGEYGANFVLVCCEYL